MRKAASWGQCPGREGCQGQRGSGSHSCFLREPLKGPERCQASSFANRQGSVSCRQSDTPAPTGARGRHPGPAFRPEQQTHHAHSEQRGALTTPRALARTPAFPDSTQSLHLPLQRKIHQRGVSNEQEGARGPLGVQRRVWGVSGAGPQGATQDAESALTPAQEPLAHSLLCFSARPPPLLTWDLGKGKSVSGSRRMLVLV